MGQPQASAWTPVDETQSASAPSGWTPVAETQAPAPEQQTSPTAGDDSGLVGENGYENKTPAVKNTTASGMLPVVGGVIGSAGGPFGTVVGAGAGKLAEHLLNTATGDEQIPDSKLGWGPSVGGEMLLNAAMYGAGKVASKIAPKLAEMALGTRLSERLYGRMPGAAALAHTTGLTPDQIAKSARAVSLELTHSLEAAGEAASKKGVTVSTQKALDVIDEAIAKARSKSLQPDIDALMEARTQLTERAGTAVAAQPTTVGGFGAANAAKVGGGNAPIPTTMSPTELLRLKQGLGDTIGNWSKVQERQGVNGTLKEAYHFLDEEWDRAVPGAARTNQIVSTLLGIKKDADMRALAPSIFQRMGMRVAAHTGALIPTAAGAYGGHKHGGTAGAVVGGLAGLVAPEMLASPTARMAAARGTEAAGRALMSGAPVGSVLHSGYNSLFGQNQEDEKK